MTSKKGSRKCRWSPGAVFKTVAATVSLMAAAVPVVVLVEHWLEHHDEPSGKTATSADYAEICRESNEGQSTRDKQFAHFKKVFASARNLTDARDALLLSTQQDIDVRSELQSHLEALKAPSTLGNVQEHLEEDWKNDLVEVRADMARLEARISSPTQFEEIIRSYPRSTIEARDVNARGQLRRLGAPDCLLEPLQEQAPARWPAKLQVELAAYHNEPHGNNAARNSSAQTAVRATEAPPAIHLSRTVTSPLTPPPAVAITEHKDGATGTETIPGAQGVATKTGP
jgi:hypothetical protein